MEAVKQVLALIAAIIGVLTALVTLYASYLDMKKKAVRESDAAQALAAVTARPAPAARVVRPDESIEPTRRDAPPPVEAIERTRALVRPPAIAILVAGVLSLLGNLFTAGFGYVDEFVTPLTTQTMQLKIRLRGREGGRAGSINCGTWAWAAGNRTGLPPRPALSRSWALPWPVQWQPGLGAA